MGRRNRVGTSQNICQSSLNEDFRIKLDLLYGISLYLGQPCCLCFLLVLYFINSFKTQRMKKNYLLTLVLGLFITNFYAQFSRNDVKFWVGSGTDSTVLVVDFKDGTEDSSSAWGYLFNASQNQTFNAMLGAIAAAEPQFSFNLSSGFLNDVHFNNHQGLGANPDYWSTWSGTSFENLTMNSGITEVLVPGSWYGLSYGFDNPTVQAPAVPQAAYSSQWLLKKDVEFWVGSGADSAVLVLDFVSSSYGEAVSYAFGVKFSGTTTGAQMLALVDAAHPALAVNATTFLNDITFNSNAGIGGQPNYWGTFSGANLSDWTMNAGISTTVNPGDWFGCSYASWPPRRPYKPIAANDPTAVSLSDVQTWVGAGSDSAVIVIDFNNGAEPESFAYGYAFSGSATAQQALLALKASVPNLDIVLASGYLNDILFLENEGIGGENGFYWGTWSATNNGGWAMNDGINVALNDGDWFACSYTDFEPALPPSTPSTPLYSLVALNELNPTAFRVFPNPVQNELTIQGKKGDLVITDLTGRIVFEARHNGFTKVDFSDFKPSCYQVTLTTDGQSSTQIILK